MMTDTHENLTDSEAAAVHQESLEPPAAAPPPASSPLSLSAEVIAACARQDIPAAGAAELRAQVALIGERARRVAIAAEYQRLLAQGSPS